MIIGVCEVVFRAEWAGSLKEKRMVAKSLIERTRNKFHVSIAEVDKQDEHKTIVIGFACISNERRHADSMIQTILRFMETHTQAEFIDAEIEIF